MTHIKNIAQYVYTDIDKILTYFITLKQPYKLRLT
jgi:hypothetical protein